MKIKKVNELVGFSIDSEYHIPTRQENVLRSKIDSMMVYFIKNQYKIDLDEMNSTTGGKEFNELYREIIKVLKKHK